MPLTFVRKNTYFYLTNNKKYRIDETLGWGGGLELLLKSPFGAVSGGKWGGGGRGGWEEKLFCQPVCMQDFLHGK